MKNILPFACLFIFICTSTSNAQRLRSENFNINTIRIPLKPLPENFKTYQTIIYNRGLDGADYSINPNEVNRAFQFDGFNPVQQNSDLVVLVYLYDVSVHRAVLKQREKDKAKGLNVYWYEQQYSFPIEVSLTDKTGNLIYKRTLNDQYTYKTSAFVSVALADSASAADRKSKIPTFVNGKWSENLNALSNEVRDLYDYQRVSREVIYYRPRKSSETDTQNAEYFNSIERAKRAFAFADNGYMNETVQKGVQSSIDFWDTQKDKITGTSKDDRRLYYACAFNAANSYFQLNNFDKALSYMPLMTKVDIDNGEADDFAKAVNAAKLRTYKSNDWAQKLKTGQVSPYLNGFVSKQTTQSLPANINPSPQGFIILRTKDNDGTGRKMEGMFDNFLGNLEKMRVKLIDNAGKENLFFLSDIQEMQAGESYYKPMRYPTNILSNKTDLVQVLFESSRIGLYRSFETVKGLDGTLLLRQGALLIKKAREEKCANLEIGSFASDFNARLSEYLDDCPMVSLKAKNGQYSLESILNAVNEYDNCR